MAHLLEHDVVPRFVRQSGFGACAETGRGVQMFGEPCAAAGVMDDFRSGQFGQHTGHVVGKGQAVAQHQDSHKNTFLIVLGQKFCSQG